MVHEVKRFLVGETTVWATEKVLKEIKKDLRDPPDRQRFIRDIIKYSNAGFVNFIGDELPIRHEWDGVYRIGPRWTQYRWIGFFENNTRENFLVFDAFMKGKHSLSAAEKSRIEKVVEIRLSGSWAYIEEED